MDTFFIGQNKIPLQTVDSTNNYAANLLKMSFVPDGTVIMAQNQTKGRGQRSNDWNSAPGLNLLCSYILQPKHFSAELGFYMSAVAALSVRETVNEFSKAHDAHIKWPNDIILNGKKIGGILIENSVQKGLLKFIIVGVGLNVNQSEFDYSHASSLFNETKIITDTDILLATLSRKLEKWYLALMSNKLDLILEEYNKNLWKKDELNTITVADVTCQTNSITVNALGQLMFSSEGKQHRCTFSEAKISYE